MLLVGYANRTFNGAAETETHDREKNATHRNKAPRKLSHVWLSLSFSSAVRGVAGLPGKIGRVQKMRALLSAR